MLTSSSSNPGQIEPLPDHYQPGFSHEKEVIMSHADLIQQKIRIPVRLFNLILIGSASLLIAVSAQLAIHLPFSPVPITAQTAAVMLTGALLGKKRGMGAVGLYLVEGLVGFPVFAGGRAGFAVLLGPTGGYLLGFAAAAYLVGALIERGWDRTLPSSGLALALGHAVIYACGLLWLAPLVGYRQALPLGLTPFLIGDALKILAASFLLAGSGFLKPGTL